MHSFVTAVGHVSKFPARGREGGVGGRWGGGGRRWDRSARRTFLRGKNEFLGSIGPQREVSRYADSILGFEPKKETGDDVLS